MKEDHISDEHLFAQAHHYLEKLENRCNTMRIFGMSEPKPVREVFVRVNILEKITSQTHRKLEELKNKVDWEEKTFGVKVETVAGFDVVNRLDKFIVLGKPGAGKSTFLKAVVLQSIDQKLNAKRLPVFVSMKRFSDSEKSLEDYIMGQFDYCNIINHRALLERGLLAGKVQVLLDGLDEVSQETQKFVIEEILSFTQKFNKNQFVISCRIAAYNYIFEQFTDVEIADFDERQIQYFIKNWFRKKTQSSEKCWEKLKDSSGLRELAQVPLLLTLLCITYEELLSFPPSRSELYQKSIDALLKKWDSSRNIYRGEVYKGLSIRRKEALLGHVAYLSFEEGKYILLKKELIHMISSFMENITEGKEEDIILNSEAVLNGIVAQHGLFVPRAKGIFSFSHLSFHEYFTAKYVVDILPPEEQKAFIGQHLGEDKWREVFSLCMEMQLRADHFLLNMKASIDEFARSKKLDQMLLDVDKIVDKSSVVQGGRGRAICIFIVCIRERAHIRGRERALALARAHGTHNDFSRYINSHFDFDFTLGFDLEGSPDRDRDISLDLALGRTRELVYDLDTISGNYPLGFSLDHVREHSRDLSLTRARDLARTLGLNRAFDRDLANALGRDRSLDRDLTRDPVSALDRIPDIEFELAHARTRAHDLLYYLTQNSILLQCLKTECYVTKPIREKVLNELLLVPSIEKDHIQAPEDEIEVNPEFEDKIEEKKWYQFWKKS